MPSEFISLSFFYEYIPLTVITYQNFPWLHQIFNSLQQSQHNLKHRHWKNRKLGMYHNTISIPERVWHGSQLKWKYQLWLTYLDIHKECSLYKECKLKQEIAWSYIIVSNSSKANGSTLMFSQDDIQLVMYIRMNSEGSSTAVVSLLTTSIEWRLMSMLTSTIK